MALGQEADEGGGSQVSTQLQMIGLRQQVDATRKELDEARAQIRRLQKQNNTLQQRMASSQRALGEDMELTQDECKLRLKKQKDAAQKKQARSTKELLANVRVAKRQDCDSFEARITYLETQITAKERQHAQDMKGMAVKVDEAAAKGKRSLQNALERAERW
jgi:polyhydroxyalkanoate synthesis regulator phasin